MGQYTLENVWNFSLNNFRLESDQKNGKFFFGNKDKTKLALKLLWKIKKKHLKSILFLKIALQ